MQKKQKCFFTFTTVALEEKAKMAFVMKNNTDQSNHYFFPIQGDMFSRKLFSLRWRRSNLIYFLKKLFQFLTP